MYDGIIQEVYAVSTHSFNVQKGNEGIFLLQNNKTGHQLQKNSYVAPEAWINDLLYSRKGDAYIASCWGMVINDLEKDLFEVIETTTGQKRKVLGLNSFEQDEQQK